MAAPSALCRPLAATIAVFVVLDASCLKVCAAHMSASRVRSAHDAVGALSTPQNTYAATDPKQRMEHRPFNDGKLLERLPAGNLSNTILNGSEHSEARDAVQRVQLSSKSSPATSDKQRLIAALMTRFQDIEKSRGNGTAPAARNHTIQASSPAGTRDGALPSDQGASFAPLPSTSRTGIQTRPTADGTAAHVEPHAKSVSPSSLVRPRPTTRNANFSTSRPAASVRDAQAPGQHVSTAALLATSSSFQEEPGHATSMPLTMRPTVKTPASTHTHTPSISSFPTTSTVTTNSPSKTLPRATNRTQRSTKTGLAQIPLIKTTPAKTASSKPAPSKPPSSKFAPSKSAAANTTPKKAPPTATPSKTTLGKTPSKTTPSKSSTVTNLGQSKGAPKPGAHGPVWKESELRNWKTMYPHALHTFLVCRTLPQVCTPPLTRLKQAIAAMGGMDVALPRYTVSICAVMATVFGLVFSWRCAVWRRRSRRFCLRHPSHASDGHTSECEVDSAAVGHGARPCVNERQDTDACNGDESNDGASLTSPPLVARFTMFWSGETPTEMVTAAVTLKLLVLVLMLEELFFLMAPEQDVLATPELILQLRKRPEPTAGVPAIVEWLLPDLDSHTADAWALWLRRVRASFLACWLTFLLVPTTTTPFFSTYARIVSTLTYSTGALAYFYLGSIGLMYNHAHSTQAPMLFMLCASFAMPDLSTNPRAANWLRQTLIMTILVPVYFFSGVSKLRYMGLNANLSGSWLPGTLTPGPRSVWPALNRRLQTPRLCMLMSWGNLYVELVGPLHTLLYTSGRYSLALRNIFFASCLAFHASIFLLMGPNFIRLATLCLVALDPLVLAKRCWHACVSRSPVMRSYIADAGKWKLALEPRTQAHTAATTVFENLQHSHESSSPPLPCRRPGSIPQLSQGYSPPCLLDHVRALLSTLVMIGWFTVQFRSDLAHLSGAVAPNKLYNPYWPLPELSMFTRPDKGGTNYWLSLSLVCASAVALAIKLAWRLRQLRTRNGRIRCMRVCGTEANQVCDNNCCGACETQGQANMSSHDVATGTALWKEQPSAAQTQLLHLIGGRSF